MLNHSHRNSLKVCVQFQKLKSSVNGYFEEQKKQKNKKKTENK